MQAPWLMLKRFTDSGDGRIERRRHQGEPQAGRKNSADTRGHRCGDIYRIHSLRRTGFLM